ncbi:MAG TPA: MIP/aquaporin family protein [Steroidobacteraceae bacterium]|nr:MIP/aquaporin family protein [Steroidobacteraceae bacterium]
MSLARRVLAETLGSLLLAATVIGSGIMAERMAAGNAALALLANTGATVAALAVLITLLAPISGAHFNPAVTLVLALRRQLGLKEAGLYVLAQVLGCCLGAVLAHAMFELPLLQVSTHVRTGPGQWLAEFVATAGLVLVILGVRRSRDAAWTVAAWIGAAYWFTASTSFANPAISLARSLTDTFTGIQPRDVPSFVLAEVLGALAALLTARFLFPTDAIHGIGRAPVATEERSATVQLSAEMKRQ